MEKSFFSQNKKGFSQNGYVFWEKKLLFRRKLIIMHLWFSPKMRMKLGEKKKCWEKGDIENAFI